MIAELNRKVAPNSALRVYGNNVSELRRSARRVSARKTNHPGVLCKVAENREEREQGFRLVYNAYRDIDLIGENPFELRVTKYHLQPVTAMFMAMFRGEPVYTVTLILDGDLGLPLEELYGPEVDSMRTAGHYLAEVSCLAGRRDLFDRKEQFNIFVDLMGLMAQYGRYHNVSRLLVAVHPRHSKFYQHFFGFENFGDLTYYSAVQGNPAVGCVHDFESTDRTGYPLREKVYAATYEPWELQAHPMPPAEQAYFGAAAEHTTGTLVPMAA